MLVIEMIVGAGICGLLWKIQRELGSISEKLGFMREIVDDHEGRIRRVEGR